MLCKTHMWMLYQQIVVEIHCWTILPLGLGFSVYLEGKLNSTLNGLEQLAGL